MTSQPDDRTVLARRVAYILEAGFVGMLGRVAVGMERPLLGVLLIAAAVGLVAGVVAPRWMMRLRRLETTLHLVAAAAGVFAIWLLFDVIRHPPPAMHPASPRPSAARSATQSPP